MNKVKLEGIRDGYNKRFDCIDKRIIICAGTGCVANGAMGIYDEFIRQLDKAGINVIVELDKEEEGTLVSKSGCQGFCQMGPLVTIIPGKTMYTKVRVSDVSEIIETSILKDGTVERLIYRNIETGEGCPSVDDIPFYKKQSRTVLKNCGLMDPSDIDEYIARGGYFAAEKAVASMSSEEICKVVKESGLRGRGGGGFPTGTKWELAMKENSADKYIICNGDEGDPGAFMDRSIMEGNPHSVIEGMLIAARAVGANAGYVYVRMEYPLAVARMKAAVRKAEEYGIIGEGAFEDRIDFKITVMEGAGAFVCGEETALIASIEGKRGMPSPKPPYPSTSGLFGKPTVINNVETLATIPIVLGNGAGEFMNTGTERSRGTKTFALTGHVRNTGLIEVPFGTTLREIIVDIAGGVVDNDGNPCGVDFKAVQIGGPSGGCLTKEHLDLPLDYESLKSVGAMVGSGGLVVMNQQTCMVGIARFFMKFTQNESCGKCIVCREGTKQMLALLDDITEGRADETTIPLLSELAGVVKVGSLCGLGKSAPNPVLSSLEFFKDEYIEHVVNKRCPTGSCKALARYRIIEEKCKGCGLCARKCPVDAITGEKGMAYRIDADKCIKCGACIEACRLSAVAMG
ncbi:MAG TPA: NADH-ubiquinone oxidoreductase-F iron-sulfur binding region domain-containing protein [Clostridia bacterium]|nr:NADH-ubiquinone oxidoreductase-F iron-sulfur binding region domain-containing protein [Clostridia bacterium]